MPKACAVKSTAKAVHRYGWTMLSVLGPKAISFTVNTSVGETITVTITKMPQCSVILAEPVQQQQKIKNSFTDTASTIIYTKEMCFDNLQLIILNKINYTMRVLVQPN